MNMNFLSTLFLVISAATALCGVMLWVRAIMRLAPGIDPSPARGSDQQGIVYAFTLGMLPWRKESTRRHWVDYLRGIVFHLGIFLAFPVLVFAPWLDLLPPLVVNAAAVVLSLAAVCGIIGLWARSIRPGLRAISRMDDYLSPALVISFLILASAFAFGFTGRSALYLGAGLMLLYLPFSKVRHSIYFFVSRVYFGKLFGHRGVIHIDHANSRGVVTNG